MTRTTFRTVTFKRPFVLGSHDAVLPAGTYKVETDEEPMPGISFLAHRRVQTLFHLLPRHGLRKTLAIDPDDLVAALARESAPIDDAAMTETPVPATSEA